MRKTVLMAMLLAGACAAPSGLPAAPGLVDIHLAPHTDIGSRLHCMTPDGNWGGYGPYTSAGRSCPAPNRFVAVASCAWGQAPAHEPLEVRVAQAADHSLVGDIYNGVPICVAPPPF